MARVRRKCVIQRRDVAEPGASSDDEIGLGERCPVLRRRAETDMAGIEAGAVVEDVLVLPGRRHGNALRFGEARERRRAAGAAKSELPP